MIGALETFWHLRPYTDNQKNGLRYKIAGITGGVVVCEASVMATGRVIDNRRPGAPARGFACW